MLSKSLGRTTPAGVLDVVSDADFKRAAKAALKQSGLRNNDFVVAAVRCCLAHARDHLVPGDEEQRGDLVLLLNRLGAVLARELSGNPFIGVSTRVEAKDLVGKEPGDMQEARGLNLPLEHLSTCLLYAVQYSMRESPDSPVETKASNVMHEAAESLMRRIAGPSWTPQLQEQWHPAKAPAVSVDF